MSVEVEILDVSSFVRNGKPTVNLLRVRTTLEIAIYLTDQALPYIPVFERYKGKMLSLDVRWTEYKGMPSLNFNSMEISETKAITLDLPPPIPTDNQFSNVDPNTGEILSAEIPSPKKKW